MTEVLNCIDALFSKSPVEDFCVKLKSIPIVGGTEIFLEQVKLHEVKATSFELTSDELFEDIFEFDWSHEKTVCPLSKDLIFM